ncbi:hypothetical protein [Streptomyces sp. NPDC088350]|uniref:hypothetical protein n=1 Tax=Streptomyces sp. NPDC088350 TaxID=3365854 RepID=UPI00382D7640
MRGAPLAFVILGVLAVVLVVNLVKDESHKLMLKPSVYDSVKVGDTETAVRDRLPHGKSYIAGALDDEGPAVPRGATCSSFLSTEDWPERGGEGARLPFLLQGRQTDREAGLHGQVVVMGRQLSAPHALQESRDQSPRRG